MFQRLETPFGCIKRYINIDYYIYYVNMFAILSQNGFFQLEPARNVMHNSEVETL